MLVEGDAFQHDLRYHVSVVHLQVVMGLAKVVGDHLTSDALQIFRVCHEPPSPAVPAKSRGDCSAAAAVSSLLPCPTRGSP